MTAPRMVVTDLRTMPTETWECEAECGWGWADGPLYVSAGGEVLCEGCAREEGRELVARAEVVCAEHGGPLSGCRPCAAEWSADAARKEFA